MNLTNYFYYWRAAFSKEWCDDIIAKGLKANPQMARIFKYEKKKELTSEDKKDLNKLRNSDVAWLEYPSMYKDVQPFIHEANERAGWNYTWDWSETFQFTVYRTNQQYGWHQDAYDDVINKPLDVNHHGKQRKLSVTICLSDPKDFEGGDFEFDFRNTHPEKKNTYVCKQVKAQGAIVVFPSFVWHRVTPVTRGVRYSLVMWNIGPPWK